MTNTQLRMMILALAALPLVSACDRAERGPADRADADPTTMNATPDRTAPATVPTDRVGEDTLGDKVDRAGEALEAQGERLGNAMEAQGEKLGEAMDDATVTARVKAALVADPDLSALEIDVDSKDGVVTLRGSVDSASESARAGTLASDTEGVVSVDNQLVVAAVD